MTRDFAITTLPSVKARIHLTPAQLSLILGLETVLQKAGLALICPFCAGSAPCDGLLTTDNHPLDLTWKLDCDCRERRGTRMGVMPMPPCGDLILLAAEALREARLDIRCPKIPTHCRYEPIRTQRLATKIQLECQCGRMVFSAARPAQKPS